MLKKENIRLIFPMRLIERTMLVKPTDVSQVFHADPDILGGTPVFVGTRVPVQSLFDHLEAGDSIEDFLEGFPSIKREQVMAVLAKSRQSLLTSV
ncbi:MAG: DUF433 domain-containing protein [Gemmatimonadetes bacterium]|nr:DUF433 domain-containing protein [Gemmatimonadota bacterium]MYA24491.1 DUF433 domain-containing protein [Gemmatimonadota bacterium]MYB70576.1 DUF433 domain-containing protein [Gemmatimonadota bacterium]